MKKCPYCAEQIPDEAVRCPYCESDLSTAAATQDAASAQPETGPPPASGHAVGEGAIGFSHSGTTYILGWGTTFFGIWDRHTPGGPVRTFPRTDDGWRDAWLAYTGMESNFVAVTPPASQSA